MRILFVTPEIYPFLKTGGLGDVSAALPQALAAKGADIRLMLPGYPAIVEALQKPRRLARLGKFFSDKDASLLIGTLPNGLTTYVIDAPHFYDRTGPYGDETGTDWHDNHLRFAALCRAAADLGLHDSNWQPEVIHGNDWQTGLIPAYVAHRPAPRPATVLTVHNLAYQGLFPHSMLETLGLPPKCFSINGVEFYGKIGFLKAGLFYADKITTVSPTYAAEIQTEAYGCGLEGLLRTRAPDLEGILNGIDRDVWNPAMDSHLVETYDAKRLKGRAANKKALLAEFNLPASEDMLFAVVSRLATQKGLDLLIETAPALLEQGARLVVLGAGDASLEKAFHALAADWPGLVGFKAGYDEALAHRMQAGADAVIVPSRFEPCGLVQMYALRYGAVPVVRRTGGLADTVMDGIGADATGFVYDKDTAAALAGALSRALKAYGDKPAWEKRQRQGMKQDFSWEAAAERYLALYAALRKTSAPLKAGEARAADLPRAEKKSRKAGRQPKGGTHDVPETNARRKAV